MRKDQKKTERIGREEKEICLKENGKYFSLNEKEKNHHLTGFTVRMLSL